MTGRIIKLHGDDHDAAQSLLPWYLTGRLDEDDRAQVEAHVAQCLECQAELKAERRLQAAIAGLAIPSHDGWARLRRRVESAPRRWSQVAASIGWAKAAGRSAYDGWRGSAPWLRWALAVQLCLMIAIGVFVAPAFNTARYRALGAAPAAQAGNIVVIFRPDTSERDLRATLDGVHARVVDGPTSTDAFVLRVAPAERARALAKLRGQRDVQLAEPVDAATPR